jgi:hypothetical protein
MIHTAMTDIKTTSMDEVSSSPKKRKLEDGETVNNLNPKKAKPVKRSKSLKEFKVLKNGIVIPPRHMDNGFVESTAFVIDDRGNLEDEGFNFHADIQTHGIPFPSTVFLRDTKENAANIKQVQELLKKCNHNAAAWVSGEETWLLFDIKREEDDVKEAAEATVVSLVEEKLLEEGQIPPNTWEGDHTGSFCLEEDDLVEYTMPMGHLYMMDAKEIPFPSSLVIRNTADNKAVAQQIRELIAEGRCANAYTYQECRGEKPEIWIQFELKEENPKPLTLHGRPAKRCTQCPAIIWKDYQYEMCEDCAYSPKNASMPKICNSCRKTMPCDYALLTCEKCMQSERTRCSLCGHNSVDENDVCTWCYSK